MDCTPATLGARVSPPCEMVRRLFILAALLAALAPAAAAAPPASVLSQADAKLDRELRQRASAPRGTSRVIVRLDAGLTPGAADAVIRSLRGTVGRRLAGGQVANVPDTSLGALARLAGVSGVSLDRRVHGTMERTGATVGATWVHDSLDLDGTGIGIAVIDSGVANWHDDLGSSRVMRFVDFVGFQTAAYDDYGHGTHVAGIIAGDGHDSGGRRRGIAPGATLLVEKVLDASGQGYISNVIAAIDYAIANKDALRLRVLNLSVAAGVYESYETDPLTLAAKRAVEAGLVVVSAAGNLGKGPGGRPQYGAIGAPGNAPWVITVGASSHNGTVDRSDDTIAGFSSRGPTALDYQAKPDVVAPGVGIESLTEAGSTLFNTKPLMRLWGTVQTATEPYLSMSGTSMASPVVTGTIALMLQANPALTPNLVKAILQFTAESRDGYNALTQGAGFLNTRGAVELAQSLASGTSTAAALPAAPTATDPTPWSRQLIWGNHRIAGGQIRAAANAWRTDVTWGSGLTPEGQLVAWGVACAAAAVPPAPGTSCEPIPWTTAASPETAPDTSSDNVVWGAECGGADCDGIVWETAETGAGIAWATTGGEDDLSTARGTTTLVWGTDALEESDDIVWGAPAIRRQSLLITDPPLR
jgi:subtilisin family serine protease